MALLRATSIQWKLTLVVMAVTTLALIIAAIQFIANDVRDYRRQVADDLGILARILGLNVTSTLDFNDPKVAAEILAGLKAKPQIRAGAVYDASGNLFASYTARGVSPKSLPHAPPTTGRHFGPEHLVVCEPILKGAETKGSIYLDFDLSGIWARVTRNCAIIAAMVVVSALIAFFITMPLQRIITRPILSLGNVANVVSEKQDYSVRAAKQTDDEIGFLIDCFNGMLAQIEKHQKTLSEVNDRLAKSEQRALAATHAKSQFLANMSHELRTPLNAIIGYSEMLQEELEDTGQTQLVSDLRKIHAAAKHQLGLINDILDLSKIEAGKISLFLETFDVAALVRDVATTVRPLVAANKDRLELYCPEHLGSMRADLTKVRQVLFNLLSNASKFTEEGVIRLSVERDGEDAPAVSATGESNHASGAPAVVPSQGIPPKSECSVFRFTVTDTGIGMSPEQLGRLFQPFTQADAATTRKYGGTGLGLAISKKFCELMGGSLTAESELGSGSTFTVTLPARAPEPERNVPGQGWCSRRQPPRPLFPTHQSWSSTMNLRRATWCAAC